MAEARQPVARPAARPGDIRKIYNDPDNPRAVHQGCDNKRNANRSTTTATTTDDTA